MQQRYKYIPVHEIVIKLGHDKSTAMPAFYALTGCDTTSSFYGKGIKIAWAAWMSLPEMTIPFQLLSCPNPSEQMIRTHTSIFQKFVCQLYGVCENRISTVDAVGTICFLKRGKDFLQMPPGSDALHQHLLRIAYQSGHVWETCWSTQQSLCQWQVGDGIQRHLTCLQYQCTEQYQHFLRKYLSL